jgi:preprotein translocase subunit SecA
MVGQAEMRQKEGIHLRGYAQQNPLIIYKKEGFEMFQGLVGRIQEEILGILFRIQLARPESLEAMEKKEQKNLSYSHSDGPVERRPVKRAEAKVGRNDLCPCGSGKKFKKCCGA